MLCAFVATSFWLPVAQEGEVNWIHDTTKEREVTAATKPDNSLRCSCGRLLARWSPTVLNSNAAL